MKRRPMLSIIAILLAALLLASCNADAQDGIFSAIADSTQDSGTKVKAYLGSAEVNGEVYYYVLTDNAVIRLGSGTDPFTTINSTKDALLVGAALVDNDGAEPGIYVHVSKSGSSDPSDSRILKYGLDGKLDESYTPVTNVKWITTNGVYYTENGTDYTMGFVAYACTMSLENRIVNVLESEDYVLASFADGNINVYYRTGSTPYGDEGTMGKANIVGFQTIDIGTPSNEFLVVVKNGSRYDVHTLTASASSGYSLKLSGNAVASLKSTFSSSGNVIHSFYYQTGSGNFAVFKTDNYFDQLEIATDSSGKMTTLNTTGYASKLRTSLVVNILPFGSSGNFIVATYSNSIWEINPTSEDDPVEIK